MKNTYFKGLEKALNYDCYIKLFAHSPGHPVVRVETKHSKEEKAKLISFYEGFNILSALNGTFYIPIKSVIANSIENGLEMLEASLKDFNCDSDDFYKFAKKQLEPIQTYLKEVRKS